MVFCSTSTIRAINLRSASRDSFGTSPPSNAIGLANHLTQALAIYSAEEAQDIHDGLRSLLSEVPILEERYQRLLQHFRSAGVAAIDGFLKGELAGPEADVAVVHAAVGAMKDIKLRADFEVYLKKFLQSLNLILPNSAGHPYRGPARRLGYLLRMVKERYKDDSLDIADAGAKVGVPRVVGPQSDI